MIAPFRKARDVLPTMFRCKYQAQKHGRRLRKVQDNTECIKASDVLLFCTLRNELTRIAYFLQYYRELGVNQGATAAAVVLAGIRDIHLIDINMSRFKPYKHLFESHVDTFHVVAESSIKNNPLNDRPVDMLLIDSLHTANHVKAELRIHAPSVNKYIFSILLINKSMTFLS